MTNKMTKITFAEYWKSKDQLLAACDEVPRIMTEYKVTKYCKIPLYECVDSDEKVYTSFKPNEVIKVLWEYNDLEHPTPKYVTIVTESEINIRYPCWDNKKMLKWVKTNTFQI